MRRKHLHRPALSDAVSGASRWVREQAYKRQNQPLQAPQNVSMLLDGTMPPMLPMHPDFSVGSIFYTQPATLIRGPDDMLSSPLGQHILNYEPPCGFVMPTFTIFDISNDPYDHMLHYNHAMTLDVGNDHLLCKVFPASLRGPGLAWFHKLPCNSINSFNELWATFIYQYICSVRQKRNISFLQTILKQEEESIRDFTRRFGQPVQQVEAYSMDAVF